MITTHGLLVCVACLLMFAPGLAPALGLGAIEARSARHEPLDARIPLTRIRSGDLEGMRVALGSPAQFELAGVARLQALELLKFTVVEQDGDRDYIRVWTDEPIAEPSLTFLVEVDWPRGRTVRGYKLRLAPAVGGVATATASSQAAPEAERKPETDAAPAPSTPATRPASSGASYGPVRTSETLWSIATRTRPDPSVSVQRMMLALLEANPEAFAIRNVNALNSGTTLRVPSRDEIGPDDRSAAIAEVKRQQAAWTEYRGSLRTVPAPQPVDAPPQPADATPQPADTAPPLPVGEPEPGGRIEVESPEAAPETTANVAEREADAEIQSLRNELALAIEEAEASRRENDELKLRLAEVEDHVRELNRLVELKSEEIAALQAELRSRAEATPAPASPEAESQPAPAEAGLQPAQAPSPAPAEAESKPMPFGLGALPINPVFLVGGAGLLLILFGVVALLRRRRASAAAAADDDALDSPGPSPRDEDDLLRELQAVAADLAVEEERPRPAKPDTGADRFDPAFDLDALAREEPDPGAVDRRTDDAPGAGGVAEAGEQRKGDSADPAVGATKPAASRTPAVAAGGRVDVEPGSDKGSGDSRATPRKGRDDPVGDDGIGAFSFEDFGEDEVQTKLDIAKVYVEMGDIGSARGYLEAVLAEGDAGQRKIAREMLSRLA